MAHLTHLSTKNRNLDWEQVKLNWTSPNQESLHSPHNQITAKRRNQRRKVKKQVQVKQNKRLLKMKLKFKKLFKLRRKK
jgi:hypothetical protein